VIHGGGWTEGFGDRTDFVLPSFELAKAGYVVFNIAYRLLPEHPWPAQLDDVQRAVRWIRANAATYGVDPQRIGSYGHSSGGHLAAFLGVRDTRDNSDPALAAFSSRVACVVDLAGDVDLNIPYGDSESNALIIRFLGGTADEVPDAYRDASPISWVGEDSAPFLILHATHDEWVPVAHARGMEAALHEAGVTVVYYEDPEAVHITSLTWQYVAPWVLTFCGVHLDPEH
jgi:acetyl esterase/lipase